MSSVTPIFTTSFNKSTNRIWCSTQILRFIFASLAQKNSCKIRDQCNANGFDVCIVISMHKDFVHIVVNELKFSRSGGEHSSLIS